MTNRKNYDMDPEYLMDDDKPTKPTRNTGARNGRKTDNSSSPYSRDIKVGPGETLVKKNPDGTFVVRKADGSMVKRRIAATRASKPETKSYDAEPKKSARSYDDYDRTPVAKPSTARANTSEIKIKPGESIVKKNPDGSVVVRKADGTLVKRRAVPEQSVSSRNSYSSRSGYGDRAEDAKRSRNSKYVNKRPAKNDGKKKLPIFWIGLGVWVAILFIFGIYMLSYTDKCLVKYEKSQANVAMKDFMAQFEQKVKDRTIVDMLDLPDATGALEDKSVVSDAYLSLFEGYTSITYEKDPKSYDTAAPFYNIYAHFAGESDPQGTMVARMTLKSENSKKVFAILQLVNWSIDKIEPALSLTKYNYSISVPDDFKVKVNGVELTDEYLTGESETNPEFEVLAQYVTMPSTIQYKVEGLFTKPDIKIYDSTGAEVGYTPDDKGNIYVAYSGGSASTEIPEDIKNYSLEAAQTWQDYLNVDLAGDNHGLYNVQKYLIEGSTYWEQAVAYATSPDILFMSDHTIADPKYTDLEVDNYIKYTDECYSIHLKFLKHMKLTRTGEEAKDLFDSTVYFIKKDGNWLIAHMVQTTK